MGTRTNSYDGILIGLTLVAKCTQAASYTNHQHVGVAKVLD